MSRYVTTIYTNAWECTCDYPYTSDGSARMSMHEAEVEGRNHAEYYDGDGSEHEVVLMGGAK